MVSGPITSWEIDGATVETVTDFIFGGSKLTAKANMYLNSDNDTILMAESKEEQKSLLIKVKRRVKKLA